MEIYVVIGKDRSVTREFEAALCDFVGECSVNLLPSDLVVSRVRRRYEELCDSDGGDVNFICHQHALGVHGNRVVYDSLAVYLLLKSFETLGDDYFLRGRFAESYECFKLALSYYGTHRSAYLPLVRALKARLARTLVEWGRYEMVLLELRRDAERGNYLLDAKATLYVRYAYGLSLVRLGRSGEAVSYLCQDYFGVMEMGEEVNVSVLESTLTLVLEETAMGMVGFGMDMFHQLAAMVIEPRLHLRDCPMQLIEFAASFAHILARSGHVRSFAEVHGTVVQFNRHLLNMNSMLLKAAVGCSFPTDSHLYSHSVEEVIHVHECLLRFVTARDSHALRKLETTTKIIDIWAEGGVSLATLEVTLRQMEGVLAPGHPFLVFLRQILIKKMGGRP